MFSCFFASTEKWTFECLFLTSTHAFYFLVKLGRKLAFKKYGFSGFYLQDL